MADLIDQLDDAIDRASEQEKVLVRVKDAFQGFEARLAALERKQARMLRLLEELAPEQSEGE